MRSNKKDPVNHPQFQFADDEHDDNMYDTDDSHDFYHESECESDFGDSQDHATRAATYTNTSMLSNSPCADGDCNAPYDETFESDRELEVDYPQVCGTEDVELNEHYDDDDDHLDHGNDYHGGYNHGEVEHPFEYQEYVHARSCANPSTCFRGYYSPLVRVHGHKACERLAGGVRLPKGYYFTLYVSTSSPLRTVLTIRKRSFLGLPSSAEMTTLEMPLPVSKQETSNLIQYGASIVI